MTKEIKKNIKSSGVDRVESKKNNPPARFNLKNFFSFLKKPSNKKNDGGNLQLLESDLIKDRVPIRFEWSRHLVAFFALLTVSFVLIMELYLLLSWWEKNKTLENSHYLQNEIRELRAEKMSLRDHYIEAFDFKGKMDNSFLILNHHVYWTNFFSFLEQNTLKNVYFENFSGNIDGHYVLPSLTNDILAVSHQNRYFASDSRSRSVSVFDEEIGDDGLGMDSGFVKFNIDLKIDPRIFNDF